MPLKLAGLLVTSGAASSALVDGALRRQVLCGGALDTALLEAGIPISEAELLHFLERASGLPSIGAQELARAERSVALLLPARLAERHGLLPLHEQGRVVDFAAGYPANPQMLEEIGFLMGREIRPVMTLEVRLREAIARCYGCPVSARHQALLALLPHVAPAESASSPSEQPIPISALAPERAPASPAPVEPSADLPVSIASLAPEPEPAPPAEPEEVLNIALPDGAQDLASSVEQVIGSERRQKRSRRTAPRDRVDVDGIARRIVDEAGGIPSFEVEAAENLTLGKARTALNDAQDRKQIFSVVLRFMLKTFDFAAAFAVVGGNAVGWTALTREGSADDKVDRVSLPLDAPSVLKTVLLTRGRFLGPVPSDPLSLSLLADMGRSEPAVAFFCPIEVRERPVAILYGDNPERPASDCKVAELALFTSEVGHRLERLVLEQKRLLARSALEQPVRPAESETPRPATPMASQSSMAASAAPGPSTEARTPAASSAEPGLTPAELFARSPVRSGDHPSDAPSGSSSGFMPLAAPGMSRGTLQPAGALPGSTTGLPPMDELFSAADRLVGANLGDRARAMAELARAPEIASALLSSRFPGPLLRARLPVSELPSPEELGPVPAALARMGAAAVRALAPLLDHRDPDTRYFAMLTAGNLPSPLLLGSVANHVFDKHPLVANAARVALAAMSGLPGFGDALAHLRAHVRAADRDVACLAAKAVGTLHDVPSIDPLIELVGSPDRTLAEAASEALREICKQDFGVQQKRWIAWWQANSARSRSEWLIGALRHRERALRAAAIDELVQITADNFGFAADGPPQVREEAILRWQEWSRARSSF